MRPLSLLALLCLPTTLAACGDKDDDTGPAGDGGAADGGADDGGAQDGGGEDGGGEDGGGEDGGGEDGGADGGADGGTTEELPELVVEAIVDQAPLTLSASEGGTFTARLAATARWPDGREASLAEALGDGSLVWEASHYWTVDNADFRLVDERHLDVTVNVLPGISDATRLAGRLLLDGAPVAEVAVGLHGPAADTVGGFVGEPGGQLSRIDLGGGDFRACDHTLVDLVGEGTLDELTVGVTDTSVCASACSNDAGGRGDWTCVDTCLDVEVGDGETLTCGETNHFLTAGGEAGFGGAVQTSAGRTLLTSGWTWDGAAWTGTGSTAVHAEASTFGVVLGLNNTKESEPGGLADLLEIRPAGGGRWTGLYTDASGSYEWSSLGSVSASSIGQGTAWAGLFTAHDLSRDAGADTPAWAWLVDPSRASSGGSLVLDTLEWSDAARAFARTRQVALAYPGFVPDQVTAVGEDLDGDGEPELLVEAWGEGRWTAWIVPEATDKSATSTVRTLASSARSDSFGSAVSISSDGTTALVGSSLVLGGSEPSTATVHSVKPVLVGQELGPDQPPAEVRWVTESWSVAAVMAADATAVEASATALGGVGPVLRTAPSTGGHGMCRFGKCYATPGYGGPVDLLVGGGDGSGPATLAEDEVALVIEDGAGGLVLGRANPTTARPFALVRTELGDVTLSIGPEGLERAVAGGSPESSTVVNDGWNMLACAVADDSDEGVAVLGFVPADVPGGGDAEPTTIRYDVSVRYGGGTGSGQLPPDTTSGGSTVPVVLSQRVVGDGALLGWRDGEGQAWLGVVDLGEVAARGEDGGELPFLQGPVAVGEPLVDRDDQLGLSATAPGMVGVPLALAEGTRYLSLDHLDSRLAGWDEPLDGTLELEAAAFGPVVMLVGAESGRAQVVALPAFEDLDAVVPVAITDPVEANETVPVPRLAASLLPDAPPVVVAVAGDGSTSLHLVDATGPRATTWNYHVWTDGWQHLGAADLNGDGLADLVLGSGSTAQLALSAGDGTVLDVEPPSAAELLGFGGLVHGGERDRECPVDADGGGAATLGVPMLGAAD